MSKKQRAAQKQKNPLAGSRNFAAVQADLERRRSSAGMPHKSAKDVRRKPKHGGWGDQ
jgi:hypothetical protein